MRRAKELEGKDIDFLDAGVSGGPGGARAGACIMVGGKEAVYRMYENLFRDLAVNNGYAYLGRSGAGHFVKMVHNGIEYGMMQALAEGVAVMKASPFNLDLEKVADLYNHRSVIESRLVGWLKRAYEQSGPELKDISGSVAQSGEGMWTVDAAKELGIRVPIIQGALDFRLQSQKNPSYTGKVVSALRHQFGGHEVKEKNKERI
jgi:6-phosphogluconate dehydrogenase